MFFAGFYKTAKKKKEKGGFDPVRGGLAVAGAGAGAATLNTLAGVPLVLSAGRWENYKGESNREFIRAGQKHHKMKSLHITHDSLAHTGRIGKNFFAPYFKNPSKQEQHAAKVMGVENLKRRHGQIHTSAFSPLGVASHEFGHAKTYSKVPKSLRHLYLPALRKYIPIAGMASGALAASSSEEKHRNLAPVLMAGGVLPMVAEEGLATYHGTKEIARQLGSRKALKSLRWTLPAFATYAALPAGLYFGAKKGVKKLDEESKKTF